MDWALEAIGRPVTLGQAFDALRLGGALVAVGLAARTQTFPVPLNMLVQREKRILGSVSDSLCDPG